MSDALKITRELRAAVDSIFAHLEGTIASFEQIKSLTPQLSAAVQRIVESNDLLNGRIPIADITLVDDPRQPLCLTDEPVGAEYQPEPRADESTPPHAGGRRFRRLPQEKLDEIRRQHQAGRNAKQIADAIGIPYATVYSRVQQLKNCSPTLPAMDFRPQQKNREEIMAERRQMLIAAAKKKGNYREA